MPSQGEYQRIPENNTPKTDYAAWHRPHLMGPQIAGEEQKETTRKAAANAIEIAVPAAP